MKRRSESGQALAAVALGLVVLIGIVGLAVDMGYLRYAQRKLQAAADSAAIAAASELQFASGNSTGAALNDSKANGFEDGVNGVHVTPNSPPVDGPFAGRANYAEVKVQQNAPTFFMRVFGINSTSLTVAAVAKLASSRGCVYSLGASGLSLSANLTAGGCGVVDNGVLNLGGILNADSIGVALSVSGCCATPQAPVTGISPAADPLAYLVAPGLGGCVPDPNINQPGGPPIFLNPGTYCAGLTIQPANTATVVFKPGLYILNGAPGLQLQGRGDVSGSGVLFYVTGGASVLVSGIGNVTFTAPTDSLPASPGVPGGVLFFQDIADVQPAQILNSNTTLSGALYFPGSPLTLGGVNSVDYLILVASSIQIQGNITFGNNYFSLANGSPIKAAVLVQ